MKRKLLRRQWFRRFAAWTDILDDDEIEKAEEKAEKRKKKEKAKKRAKAAAAARPAVPRPHSLEGWWWWLCLAVLRAAQSFVGWAMPTP
ncbi:hypothetical protein PG984_002994 [Apiospora sp. TS-2023a]